MTMHHFPVYSVTSTATFTCTTCGKEKRKRTFRAECTVSPFNTRPGGEVRTPPEVKQQSHEQAQRWCAEFLREPMCKACEDALTFSERAALSARRRAS